MLVCLNSVIIDNFDIHGPGRLTGPFKTDPPLIVDADAVLTSSMAPERFETISGKDRQILQGSRGVELIQFQFRFSGKTRKGLDEFTAREIPCASIPEAHDDGRNLSAFVRYV
jgi:hypothetical protein